MRKTQRSRATCSVHEQKHARAENAALALNMQHSTCKMNAALAREIQHSRAEYSARAGKGAFTCKMQHSTHYTSERTRNMQHSTRKMQHSRAKFPFAVIHTQESTHNVPKSASQALLSRVRFTLHATRQTPHGASRLVRALSAWCFVPAS